MVFEVFGILSAIIFLISDFPYLLDTIHNKIKPHRVTWGIVCLLNTIGFANQRASGATNSLWLFGAAVLMTGAIFLASLKNGAGGTSRLDIIALIISIIGVVLWQTFNSPLLSVLANALVAVVALIPAFIKARKYPETENGIAYLGGILSCFLAAISVGKFDLVLLILPVTSLVLQAYMCYLLYLLPRTNQ